MKKVGNSVLLVLGVLAFLCPGCTRSSRVLPRQPEPGVRTAPTWGPAVEGLQCRLRPTKRLWEVDETITFRLDLRNQGKRLFAFDASEPVQADRVALDGRWYRRPRPETEAVRIRPLAPGAEFADLAVSVPQAMRLPLTPGHHDIAVAFVLEGIEVISNPVEIEISTTR